MSTLAFVTTCKGRLHHLQQTLPLMTAQPDTECVVVDYGCPQGTAAWVAANHPGVKIVRVEDDAGFSAARARNFGAQVTSAPWLCFVDADIVLAPDFAVRIAPMLTDAICLRASQPTMETYGTCICRHSDFERIGGYDELFRSWGGEDDDLYLRLNQAGCRLTLFPGTLVAALPHSEEERTAFHDVKDRNISQRAHILYTAAKLDLIQHGVVPLTRETRTQIYREAMAAVRQGPPPHTLSVSIPVAFPNIEHFGMTLTRQLSYRLDGPSLAAPAAETYFSAHAVRKLHIGCGDHLLEGWLNTDLQPCRPGVMPLDATRPLPFADACFDYVFSEHVIEHMTFRQGCDLLAECRRILKPGGILRFATPDLAFLMSLYGPEKSEAQRAFLEWSKECFLPWAPSADDTFVINNAVRDWGHQFIYDDKVLRRSLAEAGFTNIVRRPLMESEVADLRRLENETRTPPGLLALETMVFEATKA